MQHRPAKTILILGGTSEAAALAEKLAKNPNQRVITSLAGRTHTPAEIKGELRIGGFGGVEAMAAYLDSTGIDHVIDATHPFATQISANAIKACTIANVSLERMNRPPWEKKPGDSWHVVDDLAEAAKMLPQGAIGFLALGSQHLEAFRQKNDVHFVIRMVDPPKKPIQIADHTLVLGRPGKTMKEETALFVAHKITHLICRNSGGTRGYAKIAAARAMSLSVIMVERP